METRKPYEQLICTATFGDQNQVSSNDLTKFSETAKLARDAGATHIIISDLAERTDYKEETKDCPWVEWNVGFASIFKHSVPKGLEELYPEGFVQRQMALMKGKHEVLKKFGLKAAYYGLEPHWISEQVYAKHPEWRGTRCDNPLRTVGMYFSPNTDHPEVQALYREGVSQIIKQCPLIDTFIFHTNDCGAGYPWSLKSYVNPNGPTGSLGGDMGTRVADFLKTIRKGAEEGGGEARVFTAPYMMTPDETHLVERSLEPGIGLTRMGNVPEKLIEECQLSGLGNWGDQDIPGMGTPYSIISGVSQMKQSKCRRFIAGSSSDFLAVLKVAMAEPPAQTPRQRLDVASKAAATLYSRDAVDDVLSAWETIERAKTMEEAAGVPQYGIVMLRWLTRPLVPYQEMLSEEERSYWEPYIYQSYASQPETYLDYLNLTGQPCASNWAHSSTIACAIDGIAELYQSAGALFTAALEKTKDSQIKKKLSISALRCRAKACLSITVRSVLQMGTLIYERDKALREESVDPESVPQSNDGSMGSPGLFMMYRTMRWELDNTNELISILEQSPEQIIDCSSNKQNEGSLMLGPDTLEHLRKKVKIMLKYWRSAEKGYYRSTKGG